MKFHVALLAFALSAYAQTPSGSSASGVIPIPDTSQRTKYTSAFGEDADFHFHPQSFTENHDGTVTDNVTSLMWQQTDGGEMTWEQAGKYAEKLNLAGHSDWRLPTARELSSLFDYSRNPALNPAVFPRTSAEYWWSSQALTGDPSRVWVANSGGGVGPHPKDETASAGGPKQFHVRCVRGRIMQDQPANRFVSANGIVYDRSTGLEWQSAPYDQSVTWEEALQYAHGLRLGRHGDWRVPSVKELQSLTDISSTMPAVDTKAFSLPPEGRYWSATTLFHREGDQSWILDTRLGIVTYALKTASQRVLCVRSRTNP